MDAITKDNAWWHPHYWVIETDPILGGTSARCQKCGRLAAVWPDGSKLAIPKMKWLFALPLA